MVEVNDTELDTKSQVVARVLAQYHEPSDIPSQIRGVLAPHEGLSAREGEELLSQNEGVEVDREAVRRRFEVLNDARLVQIDKDATDTPYPVNPWLAKLTEAGHEWVTEHWDSLGGDKGAVGTRIADHASRIAKNEARTNRVEDETLALRDELDEVHESLNQIREEPEFVEEFGDVRSEIDELSSEVTAIVRALKSVNMDLESFRRD
ncbi:hypothetical protein ACFQE1_03045 [Halobium palmae]|uniref:Uncharacterized protein n=1 Tax=Halobium palmae TaxID=1776492 RepID=A0ABD5RW56_9EURY